MTPPDPIRALLLANTPYIDVRAEVEFEKGTLPTAVNLPILRNAEREQVGTCYKKNGNEAATALGHKLLGGTVKAERVAAWAEFVETHPDAWIYCWRGGQRSGIAQQWLADAGIEVPRVPGGFKALRRQVIETTQAVADQTNLVLISGNTGCAKTVLINELKNSVDLEAYANHRGSSFGRKKSPAETQINFENKLGIALLQCLGEDIQRTLFVEDESGRIGRVSIPLEFHHTMKQAPVAMIEMPMAFRVAHVRREYIDDAVQTFLDADPTDGFRHFRDHQLDSLTRIKNRLGPERYATAQTQMTHALDQQERSGDVEAHEAWIELLLSGYYDRMYQYQLAGKTERLIFKGSYDEVLDWARTYSKATT
jgi:tRNA 2-selenouridine synthase